MISAKIIADSVSLSGDRITTFELQYPRFILAELNTHRLFSRNSASSRAIPIETMMEQVSETPATPIQWGLNQSGMQAGGEHEHTDICVSVWKQAAFDAVVSAGRLKALGLHKQIVNRVLEPFQMMKTIVTATEFDNFFWLRCHKDAQPEIHLLADLMYVAYENRHPTLLLDGMWHTPYYGEGYWKDCGEGVDEYGNTLEVAQKISASCCAQVSYRKLDDSLDKALTVYDRLVSMEPVHASPFEHVATPAPAFDEDYAAFWVQESGSIDDPSVDGITHTDGKSWWSGNLRGWVQFRHLLEGNTCWIYNKE